MFQVTISIKIDLISNGDESIKIFKFISLTFISTYFSMNIQKHRADQTFSFSFSHSLQTEQISEKLYRLIDSEVNNIVSTNQIMEFLSNLTNAR